MWMTKKSASPTTTRYWIAAGLGPRSALMLINPDTDIVHASWSTESDHDVIHGVWISPFDNLVGVVQGEEVAAGLGDLGAKVHSVRWRPIEA